MERKEKSHLSFRKKLLIVGLSFFFLVLLLASFFGKKGLIEIYRAQRAKKTLVQDLEHLKKKKRKLKRDIEELEKNPKAVEKKAREELWLMKPDEVVIVKKEK